MTRQQRMKIPFPVDPDDIFKIFQKPWGESRGESFRLNANGFDAMFTILMHHDSTDTDGLSERMNADDPKGFWGMLVKSAERFNEEHRDHSCIPSLGPEPLCVMMALFAIECEHQAGLVTA